MILDNDYDKVLWFLKKSDKKNGKKICELVNYIPDSLYKDIQQAIVKYYNGTLECVDTGVIFSKTIVNDDGYECYIVVKMNKGKLYLSLYRWKEEVERIEEEYELILVDIGLDDMNYYDKKIVGEYYSEVNRISFVGYGTDVDTETYKRCFSLKKVPFGYVIISSFGKIPLGKRFVNINRVMSKDINKDDFSLEDKKVKKRIKKK